MRYVVENRVDRFKGNDCETFSLDNYVGDYILAESSEEALEFAKDYLAERLIENCYDFIATSTVISVF